MDATSEVKARLNIEDVIGEYVELKRSGANYKGLSPFGNEKTPSFVVSPEKQIWHDFSSGRGGDMFSFVMEVEGLDFKAALELLARKAGVDLEAFRTPGSSRGPNKERLYELLELSAKFYQVQFRESVEALEYIFKKRKFTKQTALRWRLGYSPNNGTAVVDFARSKKFSEAEIKQAGLSSSNYRGLRDMFRGRLMIPLQDAQGRVIGFTARILADDPQAPKYINTPQTALYDKSRHVYGMHLAKESIRSSKFAVLVEGNLDVISSNQAGVTQVVATAGTALTEPHLKALSRLSEDIRLSFDSDRAGIAATERAIPIASRVGVSLSIITIPSGKDPDELIQHDPAAWQEAINNHVYALDWLIERYKKLLDLGSAQGKRQFSDVLLPVVRGLADAVEQDHYLTRIADQIAVSREALEQKYETTGKAKTVKRAVKALTPTAVDIVSMEQRKLQDNFLSLVLMRPTLREFLDIIKPPMLHTDTARELLGYLVAHPDFHGQLESIDEADLDGSTVQSLRDYVKIESLLYEELYQGLELNELHYEAARLQARLIEQYVKTQKARLMQNLETADEPTIRDILSQVKDFDALLNQVKGGIVHAQENEPR